LERHQGILTIWSLRSNITIVNEVEINALHVPLDNKNKTGEISGHQAVVVQEFLTAAKSL